MTTGSATLQGSPATDDDRMYCYRHPDRETYVRCGRCDRPICTRCAMQGPVGFRCRQCGTLANDPLTSIRPTQAVMGVGVAIGGGVIVGLIGSLIGFFTIFISFIAGGAISEAVIRVTGYKRGPVIIGIVLGGIIVGCIVGAVLSYVFLAGRAGGGPQDVASNIGAVLVNELPWLLVSAGAACVGAYSRLR